MNAEVTIYKANTLEGLLRECAFNQCDGSPMVSIDSIGQSWLDDCDYIIKNDYIPISISAIEMHFTNLKLWSWPNYTRSKAYNRYPHCHYRFRFDPVPRTGGWSPTRRHSKRNRIVPEMKQNEAWELYQREHPEYNMHVRGSRKFRDQYNLRESWDCHRKRSWKRSKIQKQWMKSEIPCTRNVDNTVCVQDENHLRDLEYSDPRVFGGVQWWGVDPEDYNIDFEELYKDEIDIEVKWNAQCDEVDMWDDEYYESPDEYYDWDVVEDYYYESDIWNHIYNSTRRDLYLKRVYKCEVCGFVKCGSDMTMNSDKILCRACNYHINTQSMRDTYYDQPTQLSASSSHTNNTKCDMCGEIFQVDPNGPYNNQIVCWECLSYEEDLEISPQYEPPCCEVCGADITYDDLGWGKDTICRYCAQDIEDAEYWKRVHQEDEDWAYESMLDANDQFWDDIGINEEYRVA